MMSVAGESASDNPSPVGKSFEVMIWEQTLPRFNKRVLRLKGSDDWEVHAPSFICLTNISTSGTCVFEAAAAIWHGMSSWMQANSPSALISITFIPRERCCFRIVVAHFNIVALVLFCVA